MEKFKRQIRLRIGEAKTMRIGYLSTRCHTSLSLDLVSLIPMGKVGGLLLSWTPDHRYFKTIQQVEFKMSICNSKILIVLSEGLPLLMQALQFNRCNNLIYNGLTQRNSPKNHISISNCIQATLSNLHLIAPANSPNTDGIDISLSQNVNIFSSTIQTGINIFVLIMRKL